MTAPAPVVRLDRADRKFLPIPTTVTSSGQPVTDATVTFAVLPKGTRPADADWQTPVSDPDGGPNKGVTIAPVANRDTYGVWVRVIDGTTVDVLEPSSVGWIIRQ